jgi:hypothetical protein
MEQAPEDDPGEKDDTGNDAYKDGQHGGGSFLCVRKLLYFEYVYIYDNPYVCMFIFLAWQQRIPLR